MARSKQQRPAGRREPGAGSAADRQRALSGRLAGAARRRAPGAAKRAAGRPLPARTAVLARPARGAPARIRPAAMLLRFVACGLISLGAGLAWFLTHSSRQVSPAGALFGILLLLAGFLVGGLLWYARDARLRSRDPRRVDDEQIVFSFVVFVLVPLGVLLLVLAVFLVALIVGLS